MRTPSTCMVHEPTDGGDPPAALLAGVDIQFLEQEPYRRRIGSTSRWIPTLQIGRFPTRPGIRESPAASCCTPLARLPLRADDIPGLARGVAVDIQRRVVSWYRQGSRPTDTAAWAR